MFLPVPLPPSPQYAVANSKMLRTDRGDNEGGDEWNSTSGGSDSPGDDDVDILIRPNGPMTVAHRQAGSGPVPFALAPEAVPPAAAAPSIRLRPIVPARVRAQEQLPEVELVRMGQRIAIEPTTSWEPNYRWRRPIWRRRFR
jgi:hypothetical protein